MSSIFNNYTGNAMLNNALMTIEALGNIKSVSEITPNLLVDLYKSQDLKEANKRLKSYTMLFTKNGLLHNDSINGDRIYEALFKAICNKCDNDGEFVCEISGLRFQNKFNEIFEHVLHGLGFTKVEINKKDTNISRNWFPLAGGLRSDAQALPQAKFTIQIHPICVVIMQFLPLSSFIYNSGILLIDSSNFEFSKAFIEMNVKVLKKRIELNNYENVKDFGKGNYLLAALSILSQKEMEDEFSDLNLWSFSNSGLGPWCKIDRVPNSLVKKLITIRRGQRQELDKILSRNESAFSFIESLEKNCEWWLLYPNLFGSGKKTTEYEGVSVKFLEAYFTAIGSEQKIEYAKYLAYLINKYKSKSFEKYLSKTDAWNDKDYQVDLYSILCEATKNGEWDLYHHLEILDNPNQIPVKNKFYNLHKITHYYYQKETYSNQLPNLENNSSIVRNICEWLISLIQQDERNGAIIKDLINNQNYNTVSYDEMLVRLYDFIDINDIFFALYDEGLKSSRYGINELLHLFFLQSNQPKFDLKDFKKPSDWSLDLPTTKWILQLQGFTNDYINYFFDKYENKELGKKPLSKFKNQIVAIPNDTNQFLRWFNEALENTNEFLKYSNEKSAVKWSDSLLYNGQGEFNPKLTRFLFKFFSLKQFIIHI